MGNLGKNIVFWLIVFASFMFVYDLFQDSGMVGGQNRIGLSDLIKKVDEGQVRDAIVQGNNIEGTLNDGTRFSTYVPNYYTEVVDKLIAGNVVVEFAPIDTKMNTLLGAIISWFPLIFLIGIWIYFMKQMQGGGRGALGFGKSKAKLLSDKAVKVTFKDVAGIDEAKEELSEIVDFLKDPGKFQALGGKIPKGCLLVGSPGTGKTLLAKAIAGEASVPFFSISGSDFVEMFVGVGASRVRDMFEQGKKNAPCIIFIDEIDAVGRNRGIGLGGGNDEREQTLNQLLVEMDGFEANEGVIIIAATNRPDVLDPALLRPGRFDRQIVVPLPDINGRAEILAVHMAKIKTGPDVDIKTIARGTPGFSGADLSNLVNEAALLAARKNLKIVTMHQLEEAKDKVMMGPERRSMKMDEDEKKLTAYHEGGHAIITIHLPVSDPIHKATIIPRGRALGMVMQLPEKDQFSLTREKMKAKLAIMMGGRVAEELIFGYDKVTSGASSDIQQATKLARAMVTEWGLSDVVGPIYHGSDQQDLYLGSSAPAKGRSPSSSDIIEAEVKKIVEEGYSTATKILKTNINQLHKLAEALLEYETLSGDEIKDLLAGKKIRDNVDEAKNLVIKSSVPKTSRAKKDKEAE